MDASVITAAIWGASARRTSSTAAGVAVRPRYAGTVTAAMTRECFLTAHRRFRRAHPGPAMEAIVRCGRNGGKAPAPHHSPQTRGRVGEILIWERGPRLRAGTAFGVQNGPIA